MKIVYFENEAVSSVLEENICHLTHSYNLFVDHIFCMGARVYSIKYRNIPKKPLVVSHL